MALRKSRLSYWWLCVLALCVGGASLVACRSNRIGRLQLELSGSAGDSAESLVVGVRSIGTAATARGDLAIAITIDPADQERLERWSAPRVGSEFAIVDHRSNSKIISGEIDCPLSGTVMFSWGDHVPAADEVNRVIAQLKSLAGLP